MVIASARDFLLLVDVPLDGERAVWFWSVLLRPATFVWIPITKYRLCRDRARRAVFAVPVPVVALRCRVPCRPSGRREAVPVENLQPMPEAALPSIRAFCAAADESWLNEIGLRRSRSSRFEHRVPVPLPANGAYVRWRTTVRARVREGSAHVQRGIARVDCLCQRQRVHGRVVRVDLVAAGGTVCRAQTSQTWAAGAVDGVVVPSVSVWVAQFAAARDREVMSLARACRRSERGSLRSSRSCSVTRRPLLYGFVVTSEITGDGEIRTSGDGLGRVALCHAGRVGDLDRMPGWTSPVKVRAGGSWLVPAANTGSVDSCRCRRVADLDAETPSCTPCLRCSSCSRTRTWSCRPSSFRISVPVAKVLPLFATSALKLANVPDPPATTAMTPTAIAASGTA